MALYSKPRNRQEAEENVAACKTDTPASATNWARRDSKPSGWRMTSGLPATTSTTPRPT